MPQPKRYAHHAATKLAGCAPQGVGKASVSPNPNTVREMETFPYRAGRAKAGEVCDNSVQMPGREDGAAFRAILVAQVVLVVRVQGVVGILP